MSLLPNFKEIQSIIVPETKGKEKIRPDRPSQIQVHFLQSKKFQQEFFQEANQ